MRDNHSGIRGWIYAGNFGPERYLYLLQRLSGLCLLFYLGLHLYVTAVRLQGPAAWTSAMAATNGPLFSFGDFLVVAGFVFHGLNGLRLVLIELGYCLGKPERQDYPYVSCVQKQRPLMYALMGLALVLIVVSAVAIL